MLNNEKKKLLDQIIASFSKEEIAWSSGYLSGFVAENQIAAPNIKTITNLTILYVTETGNSKFLASEINKKLKASKSQTKLKDILQYRASDLVKEENILLITSTHGEGEIPEAGKEFFKFLQENKPDLSKIKFLTVALGDRNYPLFCEAGKIFEEEFSKLKAQKISDRIELDLDFENHLEEVFNKVVAGFSGEKIAAGLPAATTTKNEFIGTILSNINLNDIGSSKETYHIEIAACDGEINYEPGDSIGILLGNDELKIEGKITPRLYSIASSKNEHGNEVHLTVSLLRYVDKDGKKVEGLFSGHLSRLKEGDKIKFYLSRNRNFKLPDDEKDIIMVGPGTGIAPFRSFIAERNYRCAAGKNWLFFGERNFQTDFLYQSEWQDYLSSGLLTKLDVAFSRDQKEKIYVQNRLAEKGAELFKWLENGAYFYICGDKENMAKDVENTLLNIIANEGKKSPEAAKEYLNNLSNEGRYLKDVY